MLFETVLKKSQAWADEDRMMYVVGATHGKTFEAVRKLAPKYFLLVPGVGTQGGSLKDVAEYGMNDECGLLVNLSRAIIYADNSEHFARVACEKAVAIQQEMAVYLRNKRIILD